MKKIGTFLVSAVFITGTIFGGAKGAEGLGNVYASSTDAQVVTHVNEEGSSKKTVYYFATPKLVVTGRDIKGGDVKAGDEFEMVLHLKNESTSTKLRNISIKLSSDENQITTTSGSDSIYIESMDKEENCDVTVKMKAREDLEQKNYTVNVEYNYEDNSKKTFDGTASVTVPVIQEARLGISEVKLTKTELSVDGKTSLSFKLNNMGMDTLRNVTVDFAGDTIQEISYYAGTIESGASSTVDMTITPDKVGIDDIDIKVSFEDASGNVSTYKDSVALVVNEAEDEVAAVDEAQAVSPAVLGGGAVIVIALIALIAGIVKRVSQKKYE
ncbi:hypothetical protein SAMN02910369_00443 [Lachnospiraceae bacterium NE2001]|nr:hypothetical protein SAMN02910369_00443 [Lachnospiraceae bacterium NE2001]